MTRHLLIRLLLTTMLCTGAPLLLTGCPQLAQVLPVVQQIITEIIDAERKVERLEEAGKAYFAKYPNEKMEQDYQLAVDRAKASLDIALKTAHGAEELGQADPQAAFAQFSQAFAQLMELAHNVGIVSQGGEFAAGAYQGIVVEPPLCLSRGSAQ